jgi:hemerythrin
MIAVPARQEGAQMQDPKIFQWKDAFRLGIPSVDAQHEIFFELLSDLSMGLADRQGEARLRAVLAELERHAREHFAEEEEYMAALDYPELESQRLEHRKFLEQLAGLELSGPGARSVLSLLRSWLLEHILGTDMEFSRWLGISAARRAAEAAAARERASGGLRSARTAGIAVLARIRLGLRLVTAGAKIAA